MGKRKLKPAGAVDLKTTGMSPARGHRVIEIATVRISGAGPGEAFHSMIDCGRKVTPGARQVHGISEAMFAGQPEPVLVFDYFRQFIGGDLYLVPGETEALRLHRALDDARAVGKIWLKISDRNATL